MGDKSGNGNKLETATFGAGCFWCVEAIFRELGGVSSVSSGYTGGRTEDPAYKEICTGTTGHAEVVQIVFNPKQISFSELLEVFFRTHDPTSLNCQGGDVGDQYRSVVFYHNEEQKRLTVTAKEAANSSGDWSSPVITQIAPLGKFYLAENYHQEYFESNPEQGYCRMVIKPKLEKFRKLFREKLKEQTT